MPEPHARLLADVIALGSPYPLVLTGGYAVRAHRLVNRPSQDLDVATENPAPMADIAATLRAGLEARGWKVHALETAPLSARFAVTDPATGQECEVGIHDRTYAEDARTMSSRIIDITPHANDKSACSAHGAAAECTSLIADVVLGDAGSEHVAWAVCARWLQENSDAAAWLEAHPAAAALLDAS